MTRFENAGTPANNTANGVGEGLCTVGTDEDEAVWAVCQNDVEFIRHIINGKRVRGFDDVELRFAPQLHPVGGAAEITIERRRRGGGAWGDGRGGVALRSDVNDERGERSVRRHEPKGTRGD